VFLYVAYAAIREAKDQEIGKWSSIVQMGFIMAIFLLLDFLHFLLGRCEPVPLKEYFFLNNRDLGYCNLTVEFNYTIIAALVVAALWIGIVTIYKFLMNARKA
jgi:hypothetical protein